MDIPTLTPREFCVLSLLVNRGELRLMEVEALLGGTRSESQSAVRRLKRRGLIVVDVVQGGLKLLGITAHGRDAWTEFIDWTTCVAKGMEFSRPPSSQPPREATADERRRLLAIASPEFGRLLRVAWALPAAKLSAFCGADVGDFDGQAGTLLVRCGPQQRPKRIAVGDEAAAVLREAIGFRPAGPIFLSRRGRRYTNKRVSAQFADVRRRAGVGDEVRLRRFHRPGDRGERSGPAAA